MAESRGSFVPVGLGGLAVAALSALACAKPLVEAPADQPSGELWSEAGAATELPLAGALALVALVGWAAMLVVRGGLRRLLAALVLLADAAVVTTLLTGRETLAERSSGSYTGWYWVAVGASVLLLGLAVVALRRAPEWPAMGSRYDAPGARPPVDPDDERSTWRALDEGRDPTDPRSD
jgi:hypothetical protein